MIELAGIIILGILAQWMSWKIKIPAILPLIIIGLLVGPLATLWTSNHHKLIEPIYNEATGKGLFPGKSLFYFVSLAIGIILFEGGLTLKRREVKNVQKVIIRLITVGSTVTFIGGGLAAHYVMDLNWSIAFLFSALIIVTGPTVIAPILQNVPLTRNVSTVLKWEGILIDPIGALVAVLVFEFIRTAHGGGALTSHVFISFFQIILIGFSLGLIAAFAFYQIIKNEWVPHYLLNVFTLAFVLSIFVFSDILAHESGLLSVVVMGLFLGNMDLPKLQEILDFKESLSILLISILFILLAANINIEDLRLLTNDWRSLLLFGVVALILRPIGVFLSTRHSDLSFNEKVFISWVGPRGIVAAGIASLFGLTLSLDGVEEAEFITPLVFMIVLGTVILNAATARPVAKLLNVTQGSSNGILIIGANTVSRLIGQFLHENDRRVVLVDNNKKNIDKARHLGLEALSTNVYTDDLSENIELTDIGFLIALTSNNDVNNYVIRKFRKIFGERGSYRVMAAEELAASKKDLPNQGLLSYTDDFLNFSEVARDFPAIHEVKVDSQESIAQMLDKITSNRYSIPLFFKDKESGIHVIPKEWEHIPYKDQQTSLVYFGQEIIFDQQPAIAEVTE